MILFGTGFTFYVVVMVTGNEEQDDMNLRVNLNKALEEPHTSPPTSPPSSYNPRSLHHEASFNETLAFCRDLHKPTTKKTWNDVELLPARCSRDTFAVPLGEGGLNNAIMRVWNVIKAVSKTSLKDGTYRTILLPYIRNHPSRFKPHKDLGPSKMVPLDLVFDKIAFCEMLHELGICFLCQHNPPGDDPEDWSDSVKKGVKFGGTDAIRSPEKNVLLGGALGEPLSGEIFWYLRGLQPSEKVESVVEAMRKKIGTNLYLAVHMRIEDDWRAFKRGKFYVSAENIILNITNHPFFPVLMSLTKQRNKSEKLPVFVATGLKDIAMAEWGKVSDVHTIMYDGHGLDVWAQMSLVDFELARDAAIFVGTAMFSSFTSNIAWFRHDEAICQAAMENRKVPGRLTEHITDQDIKAEDICGLMPSFAYHNMENASKGLVECKKVCWGTQE
eukprot:CAMPEP_0167750040 /NCGR_PEP_ID=MMETSP0110_2-20121227/5760_1 /TAXON_ID=629695 /ORGANISM="Gymnochlora sp., Strain CCMP2014" /LENGTH=442 /DNA_ID=CAMNT_0007635297 /DNA_START=1 /DNA_END=1329 /DNA_ORIENTATION=-